MSAVIRTTGLTKRYGDQKAVDNLHMTVQPGQIYGFLGQNGAGKTTTIRMLLGLIRPTTGQIEIFGESLYAKQRDILSRIGSIVEYSGFYENLTARENLTIHARLMGLPKRTAIEEALETVGLHGETTKQVGQYSLGMKQRLGIARAIVHQPELLLLDEPTNGLDPIGIKEIRRMIRSLAEERRMTILISTHILSEVEQLADQIGIIHQGKLLEEISLEELRSRNRKYAEFHVSSDSRAAMLLEKHFGIRDYEVYSEGRIRIYSHLGMRGELNRQLVEHGVEVTGIALSEDKLEDYFVRLIGGGTIG
ncbi:bacitracin transport system ATP-binding protein [Paenibacillus sp. UNCCL117]|uniref:ABC transporter ATP-binding protein n=1 Tax=unclassified Paenibacillus TaxID=185978 RepID=UPI000884D64F|nr:MULTISPECIES: ABC transporter ATP-binding protein [unclassified Paenibacillus]SDE62047.1 bacitracin transport system ATP-binding protein [Paenibacillus sp. cl123]SFW69867.1 bacitracin transport system ATP-binding protein [Paenibacillus sp. UNCCL117]